MIQRESIVEAGRFLKPHGIKGELTFLPNISHSFEPDECIVVEMEGIPVPFFIDGIRKKGKESLLLHIEGIESDTEAMKLANKTVFALKVNIRPEEIQQGPLMEENSDEIPADELVGYTITDEGTRSDIGEIEYIDDSTENWLFMVRSGNGSGSLIAIPIADEFITELDSENRKIVMTLPEGLLGLNN